MRVRCARLRSEGALAPSPPRAPPPRAESLLLALADSECLAHAGPLGTLAGLTGTDQTKSYGLVETQRRRCCSGRCGQLPPRTPPRAPARGPGTAGRTGERAGQWRAGLRRAERRRPGEVWKGALGRQGPAGPVPPGPHGLLGPPLDCGQTCHSLLTDRTGGGAEKHVIVPTLLRAALGWPLPPLLAGATSLGDPHGGSWGSRQPAGD